MGMVKEIRIKDIIRECNAKLICGNKDDIINNFSKNTRELEEGDIYIGIKGDKFNGNLFWKEALDKGAKAVIAENIVITDEEKNKYVDKNILIVENSILALKQIAKYKRSLYDIPVIGVTGSVGKTSTKDIIASILKEKYSVLKTEGNYNNEIGVPLTILKLKDHDAMVIEMGMNHLGEIAYLSEIVKPTIAVITNIGTAHIGNLGSRENILKAKLEILEYLQENGSAIINNDNDLLNKWNKEDYKYQKYTYGIENKSDIMAENIKLNEESSTFDIIHDGKRENAHIPIGGTHFILNSLCGIAVGKKLGMDMQDILEGIKKIEITKNRMQIIKTKNNVKIINDSYNASYDSMKVSIESLARSKGKTKIAVLGDMLELGDFSKDIHEKIGEIVYKNKIDLLITVGQLSKEIARKAIELGFNQENVYIFTNNKDAIDILRKIIKAEDVVLIKASQAMKFNQIVEQILLS